jgi:hypothetical protein
MMTIASATPSVSVRPMLSRGFFMDFFSALTMMKEFEG